MSSQEHIDHESEANSKRCKHVAAQAVEANSYHQEKGANELNDKRSKNVAYLCNFVGKHDALFLSWALFVVERLQQQQTMNNNNNKRKPTRVLCLFRKLIHLLFLISEQLIYGPIKTLKRKWYIGHWFGSYNGERNFPSTFIIFKVVSERALAKILGGLCLDFLKASRSGLQW